MRLFDHSEPEKHFWKDSIKGNPIDCLKEVTVTLLLFFSTSSRSYAL